VPNWLPAVLINAQLPEISMKQALSVVNSICK